jgi:hypothetical protein
MIVTMEFDLLPTILNRIYDHFDCQHISEDFHIKECRTHVINIIDNYIVNLCFDDEQFYLLYNIAIKMNEIENDSAVVMVTILLQYLEEHIPASKNMKLGYIITKNDGYYCCRHQLKN